MPDFVIQEPNLDLSRASSDTLLLGTEWLNSLHSPLGSGSNQSLFYDIAGGCYRDFPLTLCTALVLAMGIADGLARVP